MIELVVPGILCLLGGSAALALMRKATFRADTPGRLAAFLAGAAAAMAVWIVSVRLFWSVAGQLIVHFGERRPDPPGFGLLVAALLAWAGAQARRRGAAQRASARAAGPDAPA